VSIAKAPDADNRRVRRVALSWAVVGGAALIGSYATEIAELVGTWWKEPDYSHGFLVPVVAVAIAYKRVAGMAWCDLRRSWAGLGVLGVVLAARAWSFERGDFWLETATFLPASAALLWACGGLPLLGRTWPAVAFLAFCLPIPPVLEAGLSQPLQAVAASSSGAILRLSGLWVLNEGNVLDLGGDRLEVASACNGLAMLMSLSASVAAIILLMPMPRWKRVSLLLSALPIALACNVARIAATAYFYEAVGSAAARVFAHDAAGWLMMPLALALFGLEVSWLSWILRESEAAPSYPLPAMALVAPVR
jgi:exosortase